MHLVEMLHAVDHPGAAVAAPVVGPLLLPAVDDDLVEQAVVVEDAVAVARDAEGGHGVHVAGGQTPQAAVAQAGVALLLGQVLKGVTQLGQHLPAPRLHAHINDVVHEEAAGQKLHGQIIDPLGQGVVVGGLGAQPHADEPVADGVGQAAEVAEAVRRIDVVTEVGQDVAANVFAERIEIVEILDDRQGHGHLPVHTGLTGRTTRR